MTSLETLAIANAEMEAWENLLAECYTNGTKPTPTQIKAQWEGITEEMIRIELSKYTESTVWLVPCYYMDNGEKSVKGSTSIPYSDIRRRKFTHSTWEERFD